METRRSSISNGSITVPPCVSASLSRRVAAFRPATPTLQNPVTIRSKAVVPGKKPAAYGRRHGAVVAFARRCRKYIPPIRATTIAPQMKYTHQDQRRIRRDQTVVGGASVQADSSFRQGGIGSIHSAVARP